jgi:hypothetical protein
MAEIQQRSHNFSLENPSPLLELRDFWRLLNGETLSEFWKKALVILWWSSMVTPAGKPDFGAIVLPVPIPLLYF